MKKYKLGDILELQRGYDLPLSQQETGNVLVAGSNGIIGSHNEARGNHPCITVGRSGSVGKVHYYEQPTWAHNTTLFVKDFKGNSPRYLYYFLKNLHLDKMFAKGSSVVPSLDRNVVHSLVVPFPKDIVFQQRIASVLSNLDRKITLNRSINHNLEAMAKQLYDYWFVQFDFPDENGKPYKSSGGKMVWNEKLKREVPEGWNVAKVKDIASTYSGGTPTSRNRDYYEGGDIPWINSGELNSPIITSTSNYITEIGLNNSSARLYPQNTVLVALYGATAGKVSLLSFEACSNQAVCGVMPNKSIQITYIRYYLSSLYAHFIALSSGSARDNISQDTIKNTPLPIPQYDVLRNYSDIVNPIVNKIIANQHELELLTKLRDSLLHLLMNGQVSVNYDLASIISQLHDVKKAYFTNHRGRQVTKFVYICAEEDSTHEKGSVRWAKSRRLLPQNSAVFRHSGGVFARGRPPKHGSHGRCPPLPSDSGV